MLRKGYCKWPSIEKSNICYVADDDLWHLNIDTMSNPTRITCGIPVHYPLISPCAKYVAFSSDSYGSYEIAVVSLLHDAPIQRLTYSSSTAIPIAWFPDSSGIFYSTSHAYMPGQKEINFISLVTKESIPIGTQNTDTISFHCPQSIPFSHTRFKSLKEKVEAFLQQSEVQILFGRHTFDNITRQHMNYTGGACGQIWLLTPSHGNQRWQKFSPTCSNISIALPIVHEDDSCDLDENPERINYSFPKLGKDRLYFIAEDIQLQALLPSSSLEAFSSDDSTLPSSSPLAPGFPIENDSQNAEPSAAANVWECVIEKKYDMYSFRSFRKISNSDILSARYLHVSADGSQLIWQAGGELFFYDIHSGSTQCISQRYQMKGLAHRAIERTVRDLGEISTAILHPRAHSVVVTTRGRAFELQVDGGAARHLLESLYENHMSSSTSAVQRLTVGEVLLSEYLLGGEICVFSLKNVDNIVDEREKGNASSLSEMFVIGSSMIQEEYAGVICSDEEEDWATEKKGGKGRDRGRTRKGDKKKGGKKGKAKTKIAMGNLSTSSFQNVYPVTLFAFPKSKGVSYDTWLLHRTELAFYDEYGGKESTPQTPFSPFFNTIYHKRDEEGSSVKKYTLDFNDVNNISEASTWRCLDVSQCAIELSVACLGVVVEASACPMRSSRLALVNSRNQLLLLDLFLPGHAESNPDNWEKNSTTEGQGAKHLVCIVRILDEGEHLESFSELAWSPCGNWLAYSIRHTRYNRVIRVANISQFDSYNSSNEATVPSALTPSHRPLPSYIFHATTPQYDSFSPCWCPSGDYLYILSSRSFVVRDDPVSGRLAFDNSVKPYAIRLREKVPSPLMKLPVGLNTFVEEETEIEEDEEDSEEEPERHDSAIITSKRGMKKLLHEGIKSTRIDTESLCNRLTPIGASTGDYLKIRSLPLGEGEKRARGVLLLKEEKKEKLERHLFSYSFIKKKQTFLAEDVLDFEVSLDRQKTLIVIQKQCSELTEREEIGEFNDMEDEDIEIYLTLTGREVLMEEEDEEEDDEDQSSCQIRIENSITLDLIPLQEWRRYFERAWLQFTEYFACEKFLGLDWNVIWKIYSKIFDERVCTRTDVTDLLCDFVKETGVGHMSVYEGEDGHLMQGDDCPQQGFLGVNTVYDKVLNGYIITDTMEESIDGDSAFFPSSTGFYGRRLETGDVIIAINGKIVSEDNIHFFLGETLRHHAKQEVLLTVVPSRYSSKVKGIFESRETRQGDKLGKKDPKKDLNEFGLSAEAWKSLGKYLRRVRMRCLDKYQLHQMHYNAWTRRNAKRVAESSKGLIGYIHVPDTTEIGYREYMKQVGGTATCEGLVIDLRGNSGGFASAWILESLQQESYGVSLPRSGRDISSTHPLESMGDKPIAFLVDSNTGSDGDLWAYVVREKNERRKRDGLSKGLWSLVGERTWGSVVSVGLFDAEFQGDGGGVNVPFEFYEAYDEKKCIEGIGVSPEIVIVTPPKIQLSGGNEEEMDVTLQVGVKNIINKMDEIRKEQLVREESRKIQREAFLNKNGVRSGLIARAYKSA